MLNDVKDWGSDQNTQNMYQQLSRKFNDFYGSPSKTKICVSLKYHPKLCQLNQTIKSSKVVFSEAQMEFIYPSQTYRNNIVKIVIFYIVICLSTKHLGALKNSFKGVHAFQFENWILRSVGFLLSRDISYYKKVC